MASANKRVLAHQLSNGLFVSERLETHKDVKAPTVISTVVPYISGYISKYGELGKMFDIPLDNNNNNNKLNRNSGSFKKSVSQSGNIVNIAAQQGGTSENLHIQAIGNQKLDARVGSLNRYFSATLKAIPRMACRRLQF